MNLCRKRLFEHISFKEILAFFPGLTGILFNLIVSLLFYQLKHILLQKESPNVFSDIISLLPPWIATLVIFAIHCYLSFYVSIPGCPM